MVKMPKLMTLIMKPRYPHKQQIKTYYEIQIFTDLVLNNEIEKKSIKNKTQKTP